MTAKVIKQWKTESGYPAILRVMTEGNINGYVGVPKNHLAYGMDYYYLEPNDKIQKTINQINVHGGLTFADEGDGKVFPKGLWWFGFDTHHYCDGINFDFAWEHLKDVMTPEEKDYFQRLKRTDYPFDGEWRTPEYVEKECEKLAKQLKGIEDDRTY